MKQTGYKIPPPWERHKILVTSRLKKKKTVDDKDLRFIINQLLPLQRSDLFKVKVELEGLTNGGIDPLTDDQTKNLKNIIEIIEKQIKEISEIIELEKIGKSKN
ncbi:MAG: hypothetical protein U5L76_02285 [Patescibacteria group bacterium]|nr:hypothetical protein [Patescibacteria group bacterium]